MIAGAVPLGPVKVTGFTCTSKLSDFGNGSATVNVPCGIDPARILRLWSWRLWAFYEGTPIWCGVPTGIQETGLSTVTLTLTELPGYLIKRMFDVNPNKIYTQVEQCAIAADIAAPLGDVGVKVITSPGPGFPRDRTYDYLGNTRAELLTQLSQVISGPQFRAQYAMGPGGPECTLMIAYPRAGSAASGLGVTMPGNALDYAAAWDADQLRTRTYAVGEADPNAAPPADGSTPPKPVVIVDRPQADLPQLDMTDDAPGVSIISTLQEKADTGATLQAAPALKITAKPSEDFPDIRSYGVGDDVTIHVTTPLLPGGLTVTGQLIQRDIDAAAATAAWIIALTLPAPRARETLTQHLERIDAAGRAAFRAAPKTVIP
jgi:hypothetical protein